MRNGSVSTTAAAMLLALFLSSPATGQVVPGTGSTARLIVKLRPGTAPTADTRRQAQGRTDRVRRLAERSALKLRASRDLGNDMAGLLLQSTLAGGALNQTLATLRADPDVEFAEVDQRRYARALPDDPLYASQWYLQGVETSATNFEAAWDTTTGAADTVIAVLDTGIRYEHPDLEGRVLPGYDFVDSDSASSFATANDGDGWDNDASDPGDWLTSDDLGSSEFANCDQDPDPSSWHGTRVAAMIVAATNNNVGIAGGLWSGRVLPVRVLGKCGGYDSDIIAGMRWAAGLPVDGVPLNPTPARILNLSLGSPGNCVSSYRTAITALADAGILVVVSAGNVDPNDRSTEPVHAPANCPGALAVAGVRQVGTKVGYSSFGPEAGISAPAGNCPELDTTFLCSYSLVTADNTGQTVPVSSTYTDDENFNIGTSFSAPIVAAVAGLMHAVNDGLTGTEFTARLKASARAFPAESGIPRCPTQDPATAQCNCTTSTCGAGIADAPGAVAEALRPMARIVKPDGTGAGQNVTLDGSGSDAARSRLVTGYAWTAGSGDPLFVGATNGATATVTVPDLGLVTVLLTVTDDLGRSDTQEVTLGAAPGGGGGGGAIHPAVLLGLALLLRRRRIH